MSKAWAGLLTLVLLWGSSYALIEIVLRVWSPAAIAAIRICCGALVLGLVIGIQRKRLPGDRRS